MSPQIIFRAIPSKSVSAAGCVPLYRVTIYKLMVQNVTFPPQVLRHG